MATERKKGRPRETLTELPVYDTMEMCTAATGVPKAALSLAKKQGCQFIRHGRVHFAEFVHWWFNRDEADEAEQAVDWGGRDKRATALLKEVKLEEAHERVIEFSISERYVRWLVSVAFFGELERIKSEFPAALKGKNEVEIFEEIDRQVKQIKRSVESSIKIWIAKRGKV